MSSGLTICVSFCQPLRPSGPSSPTRSPCHSADADASPQPFSRASSTQAQQQGDSIPLSPSPSALNVPCASLQSSFCRWVERRSGETQKQPQSPCSSRVDPLFPWCSTLRPFPRGRYTERRSVCQTLYGAVLLCFDEELRMEVAVKRSERARLEKRVSLHGSKVLEDPAMEHRIMQHLAGGRCLHHGRGLDQLSADVRAGQRFVLSSLAQYEDDAFLYTVTPYCSGGDLFNALLGEGRFSEAHARPVFRQLALGVRFMHAMGVAHLDLSLENLLMTSQHQLRISDYGIARPLLLDEATHRPLPFPAGETRPGKPSYMSPEIHHGDAFDGPSSDVWSMGVVLFMLLLGCPPFRVPDAKDARFALVRAGHIRRLLRAWEMDRVVSSEAESLLSGMLSAEATRLSVQDVLRHPWLQR